jgi:hypothetical protein
MKRLTDPSAELDPSQARLASLVRSATPFRANPFRKRMVLQRLSRVSERRSWLWLHPALGTAALYLLGSASIAAAAYGLYERTRGVSRTPPVAALPAAPRKDTPKPVGAPALTPAPIAEDDGSLAPSPAETRTAPRHDARSPAAHDPKVSSRHDGEDPTEVLEAIRALRKQGDAARAQVLLDQYLKAHPSGALTEDALVLSIEAAVARHDPKAIDYAKRYLTRFPHGRFRALASRVVAGN